MKKLIYSGIAILLFSGCGNRNQPPTETQCEKPVVARQILHPLLLEEVTNKYYSYYQTPQKRNLPLEIFFSDSVQSPELFGSDSSIFVSYFDQRSDSPEKYYKGILMVDSMVLVVFDRNNVGQIFYDTNKLVSMPFEFIKKALRKQDEIRYASVIVIKGDSLYHWQGK